MNLVTTYSQGNFFTYQNLSGVVGRYLGDSAIGHEFNSYKMAQFFFSMVTAIVLEKREQILAKSTNITFYIIFIIILDAFETGMPARYEWKHYPVFQLMEIFLSRSGKQFMEKKHSVLNETEPLPDRTGKQSLLLQQCVFPTKGEINHLVQVAKELKDPLKT